MTIPDKHEQQHDDFYQNLRQRIRDWASSKEGKASKFTELLMVAPDLLHLLCKLTLDKEVPIPAKAKLGATIAYFISPIDLIPEALVGPAGYVDDIALAAYVLNGIINQASPEVVRKHWAGEDDVVEVIQRVLEVADEMVGSGLWKKLKGMF